MWTNSVYVSRAFCDLQSCNWKQDQPHWLCSKILASILLSRSYCWCSAKFIWGIRWIQGHKCCLSFIAIAKRKISDSDLLMEKRTSAKMPSICASAVPLRRDLFQPCWAVLRLFWPYLLFSDMKMWHVHYACCVWNSLNQPQSVPFWRWGSCALIVAKGIRSSPF